MEDGPKINLRKHVSPKVPRSYLWKILIYCILIGGLVVLVQVLQKPKEKKATKTDVHKVKEIKNIRVEE